MRYDLTNYDSSLNLVLVDEVFTHSSEQNPSSVSFVLRTQHQVQAPVPRTPIRDPAIHSSSALQNRVRRRTTVAGGHQVAEGL